MDNEDLQNHFCKILDRILKQVRNEIRKSEFFNDLQVLYSTIYQFSSGHTAAHVNSPFKSNIRIDRLWVIKIYEKYMNELPILRSIENIKKELSLLKNVFAYPIRMLIIKPDDNKILFKHYFWLNLYYKYSAFYLIIYVTDLPKDIIMQIGKLLINSSKHDWLPMIFH